MSRLAALLVFVGVFAVVGCGKSEDEGKTDGGMGGIPDVSGEYGGMTLQEAADKGLGQTPDNEDPDVLAFLEEKGWSLARDFADGKPFYRLSVENPNDFWRKWMSRPTITR